MKTKQSSMMAVFTKECNNAINLGGKMETAERFILIDKKSEKRVVDACVYVGRSRSSSPVKAALWVRLSDKKKPEGWEYGGTSGKGRASGHYSEAIANAVESAGIEATEFFDQLQKMLNDPRARQWIKATDYNYGTSTLADFLQAGRVITNVINNLEDCN